MRRSPGKMQATMTLNNYFYCDKIIQIVNINNIPYILWDRLG